MPDTDKTASKPKRAVHPNSLKNLLTIGAKYRYGGELDVRCKCGRRAVSGGQVCIFHGGMRRLQAQGRGSERIKTHHAIKREEREGLVPDGLAQHPAWQAVRAKPHTLADVAKDMLAAYRKMQDTGDADEWGAMLARVRDMGIL